MNNDIQATVPGHIRTRVGCGFDLIENSLSKDQSTSNDLGGKALKLLTNLCINIVIFSRSWSLFNANERELYSSLKKVNKGEQTLNQMEAGKTPFRDVIYIPTRLAFLEFANSLEKYRKKEETDEKEKEGTDEKVNRFGPITIGETPGRKKQPGSVTSQAETLLACMEWKTFKNKNENAHSEIQRCYRSAHGISDQTIKPIPETGSETFTIGNVAESFQEMYEGKTKGTEEKTIGMYEAFYTFRKEIIEHQRSYERVKNGLLNDQSLLRAHDAVMEIFSRFSDEKGHPLECRMLRALQAPPSEQDLS